MEFKDLAGQLQEGQLDSVGKFSLDSTRSDSQFANQVALQPYLFLGRLLQAANVAGASRICYTTRPNQISVQIELTDLSPFLSCLEFLAGRLPPEGLVQQYLQEAFGCARALKPKRLDLHLIGPEKSYDFNLLSGTLDESPTGKSFQGLLLEFASPPRLWGFIDRWLTVLSEKLQQTPQAYLDDRFKTPEEFVVLKCCFSAVPVFLNGKHIRFEPCETYEDWTRRRQVVESSPEPHSAFKLIHMKLVDGRFAGSSWFQGPPPSKFQSLSAVLYDPQLSKPSRLGAEPKQMTEIFAKTDWKCNWVLSISLPGLGLDPSRESDSCKVTNLKGLFRSWDSCEREYFGLLICGLWEPAPGGLWEPVPRGPEIRFRLTSLSFLSLPECLQAKPYLQEDLQQVCCSSFVGVRYGLEPACLVPVKDGLALSAESPPTLSKGAFIVAVEPRLKVDLNGTKAIKDGVYEGFVSDCEAQMNRLLDEGRYPKRPSASVEQKGASGESRSMS